MFLSGIVWLMMCMFYNFLLHIQFLYRYLIVKSLKTIVFLLNSLKKIKIFYKNFQNFFIRFFTILFRRLWKKIFIILNFSSKISYNLYCYCFSFLFYLFNKFIILIKKIKNNNNFLICVFFLKKKIIIFYNFIFYYHDATFIYITFRKIKFVIFFIINYMTLRIVDFFKKLNFFDFFKNLIFIFMHFFFLKYFYFNFLKKNIYLVMLLYLFNKNKVIYLFRLYKFLNKKLFIYIFSYFYSIWKNILIFLKNYFVYIFQRNKFIRYFNVNIFFNIKVLSFSKVLSLKIKKTFFSKINYFFILKNLNVLKKKQFFIYLLKKKITIILTKKIIKKRISNIFVLYYELLLIFPFRFLNFFIKLYLFNIYNLLKKNDKYDWSLFTYNFFFKKRLDIFFINCFTKNPFLFSWEFFNVNTKNYQNFIHFFYKNFYFFIKIQKNFKQKYFILLNYWLKLRFENNLIILYLFLNNIQKNTVNNFIKISLLHYLNFKKQQQIKLILTWIITLNYENVRYFKKKHWFYYKNKRCFWTFKKFLNQNKFILIDHNYLQNYFNKIFTVAWFIKTEKLCERELYLSKKIRKKNKYFKIRKRIAKNIVKKITFFKKKRIIKRERNYFAKNRRKGVFYKDKLYSYKINKLLQKKIKDN
jgi:hypothetical protein